MPLLLTFEDTLLETNDDFISPGPDTLIGGPPGELATFLVHDDMAGRNRICPSRHAQRCHAKKERISP